MHVFSVLQELNKEMNKNDPEWQRKYEARLEEATAHVEFCCVLYRHQLKKGRHFVHEHPWNARSWKLPCIEELKEDSRVNVAYANMCRFGMTTHIDKRDGPRGLVSKPTGFMTSGWGMYQELCKPCKGGHLHLPLSGSRASACQEYPKDLCKAICRGILKQKALDAEGHRVTGGMDQGQMYSFMCRVIDEPTTRRLRARSEHRPMM